MLPEPQHRPSCFAELVISVLVTRLIAGDLALPVVRIGLRRHKMLLATVPEAAVNMDRHFQPGECDIDGPAPVRLQGPVGYAESPPPPVQLPPHHHLRLSVP